VIPGPFSFPGAGSFGGFNALTMPTEYPTDPADEFDPETDLLESIDLVSPGEGHISSDSQEETLSFYVPANKLRSAVKWFLAWSESDDTNYKLIRHQPAPHPRFPTLRAYTLSYKQLGPVSNTENADGETYVESEFEGPEGETLYYGGYSHSLITVRYKSFGRMRFLADEEIGDYTDEWKRNFRYVADAQLDQLTADGAPNFAFAEGAPATTGPDGKPIPFPVPLATPLPKATFTLSWYHLPHDYISDDPVILNPVKFLKCLGKVNSDSFLGFSPGVLAMLEAPKFEEVLFPLIPDDPTDTPFTGWNVHIKISYFDPPRGVPTSSHRGHNLMPFRGTGVPGDTSAGKFYYATRTGDPADEPLLEAVPFWAMLSHAKDPST
jgi:hypothetical protein